MQPLEAASCALLRGCTKQPAMARYGQTIVGDGTPQFEIKASQRHEPYTAARKSKWSHSPATNAGEYRRNTKADFNGRLFAFLPSQQAVDLQWRNAYRPQRDGPCPSPTNRHRHYITQRQRKQSCSPKILHVEPVSV